MWLYGCGSNDFEMWISFRNTAAALKKRRPRLRRRQLRRRLRGRLDAVFYGNNDEGFASGVGNDEVGVSLSLV